MNEMIVYQCEKCHKAYTSKEAAKQCCVIKSKVYSCEVCGVVTHPYYSICAKCRTNKRYTEATKVPYKDYKVAMLYSEDTDNYYTEVDDLYEDIYERAWEEDSNIKEEDVEYPKWAYGCYETPFKIDIEYAVQSAGEDMYEDFRADKHAVDLGELFEFVEKWNKKQTAKAYDVDYKTVVLFD